MTFREATTPTMCLHCAGKGYLSNSQDGTSKFVCPQCNGRGILYVKVMQETWPDDPEEYKRAFKEALR